jgi:hypothetical protein
MCPLKFIMLTTIVRGEDSRMASQSDEWVTQCYEEKCEWWDHDQSRCAVPLIAASQFGQGSET